METIDYGNDVRRQIFETVFWSDADRNHSAFQAFVDCYTPIDINEHITRDWYSFRAGWNANETSQ